MRADEVLVPRDMESRVVWLRVLKAIELLLEQSLPSQGDEVRHGAKQPGHVADEGVDEEGGEQQRQRLRPVRQTDRYHGRSMGRPARAVNRLTAGPRPRSAAELALLEGGQA